MKLQKQMTTLFFMLLTTSSLLLSGCSKIEETPIVSINNTNLYMEDFLYNIYVMEAEGNDMEEYYQTKLGYSYWDYEMNGTSLRETAKNSVLTRVVMNEILSDQAQKKGFTLSANEISADKKAIEDLYKTASQEEFDSIGLTREVLERTYHKISLSDKYYQELTKDFKIDEESLEKGLHIEDYREYKTECLYIPTVIVDNQTITQETPEQITEANLIMDNTLTKLKKGAPFDELLNHEKSLTYYSRDFVYGDSVYEQEYQDGAITLENDAYSDVITTDYGYYIIHMIDNNSLDQYEAALEEAISNEMDLQFSSLYNKIKEKYEITIDFDYWDTIKLGSITSFVK